MASSAISFTQVVDINQTEWDCTAICGALNEDGECSKVTHCLEIVDGKVNGAGTAKSISHIAERAMAVMAFAVGNWMLF